MKMRKKKKVSELSFAEYLIYKHGFFKAQKTLLFVACWLIVCEKLGRPPHTVDEYSDWWRKSRAQGFREQAMFRACTGMDTPTLIWQQVREDMAVQAEKKNAEKLARELGRYQFDLP